MKGRNITIIFIFFFILSTNLSFPFKCLNSNGNNINLINKIDLKNNGYWNLTGANIFIDDLDPSRNWSYTASQYDWCSGSGTWNEPYIIENVTIDGQNTGSCITIKNSNKFFKINNCTLYNSGSLNTRMGIKLENVENGLITNNSCYLNGNGIYALLNNNITIMQNNASNNAYSGFHFNGNQSRVTNNTASYNSYDGISLFSYSRDIIVSNNTVSYNGRSGINLYSSDKSVIADNLIKYNGYGIYLYRDCDNNNLTRNKVFHNNNGGIVIFACFYETAQDNIISENIIHHNGVAGIRLEGVYEDDFYPNIECYRNIVYNNEIVDHTYGIFIKNYAIENVIFGNNISQSSYNGIYIRFGSELNLIYENRLTSSTYENAKDNVGNNYWDNGIIGNYYDDYQGKDENDDGIGDTPHNIGGLGGSVDHFPIWDDGDDIPTLINIIKPINNTFFGVIPPNYEVLIDAADLDTSWYTLNDGIKYIFTTSTGIINQSAWDACDNGTVKITFFVNDTAGHLGSKEVYVYKDIYFPNITIISPKKNQLFSHETIEFGVVVDESNLNSIWYTLNGGPIYLCNETTGMLNSEAWESCGNGSVIIRFYANDSAGNVDLSEVIVRKDVESPIISIISPTSFQLFGNNTIDFELTIDDGNLNTTWYTLDNGLNNYTFLGTLGIIDQDAWDACDNGTVTLGFYTNDTVGNIAFKEVIVRKDNINPVINIIKPEPYDTFGNSTFSYEIHIDEANLHSIWYSFNNGINNYFINQSMGIIDQEFWDLFGNGTVILSFYVNDSVGNLGLSQVMIRKNIYAPVIVFDFSDTYLNTTTPEYYHKGLEVSCEVLNYTSLLWVYLCENSSGLMENRSMIYLGNGIWTYTIDITALEWKDQFSFYFLTKDILGYSGINNNFTNMYTIKIHDFQVPIITINSPITNELYGLQAPTFDIDINELYLQEKWYSLNGGNNITFTTETQFDQTEWNKIENGTVLIIFYAIDETGNMNSSKVIVRKDGYLPDIIINSPMDMQKFGKTAPDFNISIIEENFVSAWYTIEGIVGIFNFTGLTGTINQDAWDNAPEGEITITFYAIDGAGSTGSESVVVIKSIPSTGPVIPGYNIFLILSVLSGFTILLNKIKKKS